MSKLLISILRAGLGLSGLGAVVFLGGMQGWLKLNIFSSMTSKQLLFAFIFSLGCITVVTLTLMAIDFISKKKQHKESQKVTTIVTDEAKGATTIGDNSPVTIGNNNGTK
ncbi:hypothetical protein UB37_16995 [Photobacterium iliopiscarium]|uniref:Uncharacterized protein n=1 Tax=Photobacterium iliopiscarium TaxID=56192 RepID=A0ABX5GU32_9GAMM|nr:hypothetical protein [Photobacterium iliopiscarium]KJG19677.1 hypothetical protein UB37_16995 [Photobacterium iliopiscarium]PSW98208.1 hypothetical protein C9J52_08440 [Photobacterium iliopiscarium]